MPFTSKILLFFVILGAVNIITLLIIKNKSRSIKVEKREKCKKGDIRVLNYDDEDLLCMVDNDLEFRYGCSDLEVFKNMKITHRNMYTFSNFNNLYEKIDLRLFMANYIRENIVDFSDLSEEEKKI